MSKKKVIKIVICVVAVIAICIVVIFIIRSKKDYKKIFGMSEAEIISILDKNKYEYKRRAYDNALIDINDEMSINGVKGKYTIELYEGKVITVRFYVDIHEDSYEECKEKEDLINAYLTKKYGEPFERYIGYSDSMYREKDGLEVEFYDLSKGVSHMSIVWYYRPAWNEN